MKTKVGKVQTHGRSAAQFVQFGGKKLKSGLPFD